jgi:hypothetical protein
MNWVEQNQETGRSSNATLDKVKEYEAEKKATLPTVQKEAAKGELPFETIKFVPVRSPGIYEGEFGPKNGDLVFHIWPYGYRQAEREGKVKPRFKQPDIEQVIDRVMAEMFTATRVRYSDLREQNGSFYIQAVGWASSQFARDLAVKACEKLHKALGGE